jgi:hypothetical protein
VIAQAFSPPPRSSPAASIRLREQNYFVTQTQAQRFDLNPLSSGK